MQQLEYHAALKAVQEGKLVVLLPEGANPNYLAFGAQRYHPCAVRVGRQPSYRETVWVYGAAKQMVLEEFRDEPGCSRSKVAAWLVDGEKAPDADCEHGRGQL